MASASFLSSRTARIWIVLLFALAVLSFLAMRRGIGKATQMKTETTSVLSAAQLKPGDEMKVVLEVTAVVPDSSLTGNLLEKQTETVYRQTGNKKKLAFDAATPVVMGKESDVREGAVVHITAKIGDDGIARAQKIVVLTGYVRVQ
jgi:hypothetical protein